MPYLAGFITPQDYGALGNGVNDDTAAINNALNAAPVGGAVFMPPGTYTISTPVIIPPQVRLFGVHSSHIDSTTCSIQPSASFTGASIILLVDQTTGGYSIPSNQQSIFDITLDGSLLSGSTIDGIQMQGFVHGVIVQDVQIRQAPNHGVAFVSNGSGASYSHRFTRVVAYHTGSHGFSPAITDSTWIDCEAIGAGGSGFNFAGSAANSLFIGCRSEFSGVNGYSFNGSWTTGNGSGGMTFTGCSTDRSVGHGISISATGTVPLVFTGTMLRRDGSNGSGNALNVNGATIPITFDGIYVHPGVNDDGTGTASPVTAVSVTSATYVNLATGWIHGITNTISNGGSNTAFRIGPNIGLATGTTASPTYVNNNPWGTDSGSTFTANLSANDQTGIKVVQASTFTNLNNALVDLTSGTAGTDYIFKGKVTGDTNSRFGINASGQLNWGPGNATFDANLYRSAANVVKTDYSLSAVQGFRLNTTSIAGSVGAFAIADATTAPTGTPAGGGILWSASGLPHWIASDGGTYLLSPPNTVQPTDIGYTAWAFDPSLASNASGTSQGSGGLILTRIQIRSNVSLTKLVVGVVSAGSGLTSGQNFLGLYNSTGTLVAQTADLTASIVANTELDGALTGSYAATPGFYWVAALFNFSTSSPTLARGQGQISNLGQTQVAASAKRYGFITGANTTLPASITPSSITLSATTWMWAAAI